MAFPLFKMHSTMMNIYGVTNADYIPGITEKIASKERHSQEFINSIFAKNGYKLIEGQKYINGVQKLKYLCPEHGEQEISLSSLLNGHQCTKCAYEQNGRDRLGEKHPMWRGGLTELKIHLRQYISPWVSDSMKSCNYKCVITNERKDWEVHHLVSFNTIMYETLEYLRLEPKQYLSDYTYNELNLIDSKCLQLHYKYGLGVCLEKSIHALFHLEYGKGDNTPEQFEEFKERYLKGEFDGRSIKAS
jgi:hypothetical protein